MRNSNISTKLNYHSATFLRERKSIKWSRWESPVIAADFAEMDCATPIEIREALEMLILNDDFGYPDYDSGLVSKLKACYANRVKEKYGCEINRDRVELLAQVLQGICCCLLSLTNEGDEVVIQSPIYGPIRQAVEKLNRTVVELPVTRSRDGFTIKTEHIGELERRKIKLILLCNPHNPTGSVLSSRQMDQLIAIAKIKKIPLVLDEIHEDFIYDASSFQSILLHQHDLGGNFIVLTSASKSYNISGLRCALMYFGNDSLYERFKELPWHLRSGSSLPGILATFIAWTKANNWLIENLRYLEDNRNMVYEVLSPCLPQGHIVKPPSTYFYWLDFSHLRENDVHRYFVDKAQISMRNGLSFGSDFGHMLRLNFAMERRELEVVMNRIASVLVRRRSASAL